MYFFVVVVILEVEIKATCQVGSEGQIDCLFEDVLQHRYRLWWNSLFFALDNSRLNTLTKSLSQRVLRAGVYPLAPPFRLEAILSCT